MPAKILFKVWKSVGIPRFLVILIVIAIVRWIFCIFPFVIISVICSMTFRVN